MALPLTIRNITNTPITLKTVERFLPDPTNNVANITSGITTLMSNVTSTVTNTTTRAAATPIEGKQPYKLREVDIHIDAFQQVKTDVMAPETGKKERVRLTFECDGQRYIIATPAASNASAKFHSPAQQPRHEFTGVYLPNRDFLAVYSTANMDSWMKELENDTPLSALSLPGTHNSPTCHLAPPSVRCQAVSPREQLENGVRFFDIRVQPQFPNDLSKEELILVHSAFPISLTGNKYFRDLITTVQEWLKEHPSETLVMTVKREGTGNATDEQLGRILLDHYAGDINHWYTEPGRIPKLGELRGKITLMRRFHIGPKLKEQWNGRGWCIDGSNWADNTPFAANPNGLIAIQDFYEVLETENIDKKINYCTAQLERAGQCKWEPGQMHAANEKPNPIYINFLSASNFWKVQTWPEKIAAKLNPAMVDWLCREHSEKSGDGDWSTGVVVCDWVGRDGDWDLVRCIVGMNSKLIAKGR